MIRTRLGGGTIAAIFVVLAVSAVIIGAWYQSRHPLTITVTRYTGLQMRSPGPVSQPVYFRVSNRWFFHVDATCSVILVSPTGRRSSPLPLETGESTRLIVSVNRWHTLRSEGYLPLATIPPDDTFDTSCTRVR